MKRLVVTRPSWQRITGFTLLEVLIAMMILAIAFAGSYLALSSTAAHFFMLEDKTAAEWVALNTMATAQLGLLGTLAAGSSSSGSEKMFQDDWKWSLQASQSPNPTILLLTVTVGKKTGRSQVVLNGYAVSQKIQGPAP